MIDCMNAKAHFLYLRLSVRAAWRDAKSSIRELNEALSDSKAR